MTGVFVLLELAFEEELEALSGVPVAAIVGARFTDAAWADRTTNTVRAAMVAALPFIGRLQGGATPKGRVFTENSWPQRGQVKN